ncbi:peptidase S8/S53 domain-containing protein, partial [Coemansia spiralis]
MPGVNVHHQYEHVFNGISVKTQNEIDATHLASVDGVKRVWPVRYYKLQKTNSSSASSFPFVHQPTGVNQAIKRLGMTGKGVKVGIVDTGVDYSHPELGNCWKTPGCPWQYGEDFIGDSYNPKDPDTAIKPNPTPMDCDGHGTHVSGIIAGQGPTVYGVAPGVTLGMYRVFSCPAADGSTHTSEDIIIKALESAVKDNHDIINMSLGGGGWPFEPISIACTNAVKRGITVVAAIGNDSVGGLHSASAPAVAEGVISVGSVSNWNDTGAMATVTTAQSSKSVFISMPVIPGKAFVFDSATPLAAPLDLAGSSLGCSNITDDLSGKIAVLMRGTCLIETKGKMAQNAGAIGVVLVNNVPGIVYPAIEHPFDIPMVVVPTADGQFMMEGISHGATTIVAHKYNTSTIPIESGGQVSTFSSIGPDPLLNISPHILAPGGNIYSTFPLKKEGYAILSGTSMAAPYVVGAVALLKEARPELSVSELDMLLSTTAKPALLAINESIAHPYAGGSGLL